MRLDTPELDGFDSRPLMPPEHVLTRPAAEGGLTQLLSEVMSGFGSLTDR